MCLVGRYCLKYHVPRYKKRENKEAWICRVGQNAIWWASHRVNKHILKQNYKNYNCNMTSK